MSNEAEEEDEKDAVWSPRSPRAVRLQACNGEPARLLPIPMDLTQRRGRRRVGLRSLCLSGNSAALQLCVKPARRGRRSPKDRLGFSTRDTRRAAGACNRSQDSLARRVRRIDNPTVTNAATVVSEACGHQGRMVWKDISRRGAGAQRWTIERTDSLLRDGHTIVLEPIDHQPSTTNLLQGAGGVGGLLAEIQDGEPYFAGFDANGNVTEYVSTNGLTEAHYEYGPFGEIVVQSGELADVFNHRFSTKPWCGVTGLNEYLFRKYGSFLARWLSRDLIAERGGLNLYGYVGNAPLVRFDRLGLSWLVCDKCERGRIRYAGPAAYTLVSVAYPGFPNAVDAANSALASSELLNHIMLFANVAAGVAAEAVLAEVAKAVADWAIGYSMNRGWTAEMSAEVAAIKKKLGEATGVNVAVKVRWQKCETTFTPGLKGLTTRLDWVDKSEWYTYEDPSADGSTLPGSFGPNDMDAIMKALPAAFAEAIEEVVK